MDRPRYRKHFLPCSAAARAVINEPLAAAASTRHPSARPLIRRLRRGKLAGMAGVPRMNSETSTPHSASSCASARLQAGRR